MFRKASLVLAFVGFTASLSALASELTVLPAAGGAGIQAALDSLPVGGTVVLASGEYVVNTPIILHKDHQTVRGIGDATVLYLADGANCPVVVLGSPTDKSVTTKDIRLCNLLIDGNRTKQAKEVWRILSDGAGVYNNGVDVWNVNGATVEKVVCCHCRSGGMVTSGCTRHLTVKDYTAFDNQFDGLACYFTEDSDFSGLNLHDNLSAGISLDLNFNHNVIHDSVLSGNDLGIFMRQSCGNTFHSLKIERSRHHGVFMAQTFVGSPKGLQPCPDSECAGNTFDNLLVAHCGGKGFLVNDVTCTNNVLSGAQFADDAGGEVGQAAPNLITLKMLALPPVSDVAVRPDKVVPAGRTMTSGIATAVIAPKTL